MDHNEDALQEMLALLRTEREALSAGEYRELHELAARKRALMVEIEGMETREVGRLREIMHLSVQNGIMIEAALCFWKRAHAKMLGMEGAGVISYGGSGAGSIVDEHNR